MRSSLQHYSIKNPHIAQRCRVSLMPPPVRIGEANPGYAKLASALFHKKPAHRAAMPGFFDAPPLRIGEANPVLPTGAPGATWRQGYLYRIATKSARQRRPCA
jgi:hypothetical protein